MSCQAKSIFNILAISPTWISSTGSVIIQGGSNSMKNIFGFPLIFVTWDNNVTSTQRPLWEHQGAKKILIMILANSCHIYFVFFFVDLEFICIAIQLQLWAKVAIWMISANCPFVTLRYYNISKLSVFVTLTWAVLCHTLKWRCHLVRSLGSFSIHYKGISFNGVMR